jgi:ubiquinone/menaquinone biosynthesis C-methylase UbiE
MERFFKTNLKRWNELAKVHFESEYYDLEGFRAGRSSLHSIEFEELGEVSGKSLLHLQCQFGLDALSWARLGAVVTGVDFSDKAIKLAKTLSKQLNIPAKFVCSNIYDLPKVLEGHFDIVFTSYGALCWLPDIEKWAEIVSRYLEKGGTFFIAEFHPFVWVFDWDEQIELKVRHTYFHTGEPYYFEREASYADAKAYVENRAYYQWQHSLSDIANALIKAGLRTEEIKEYPYSIDRLFPFMKKCEDGYWRFTNKDYDIPLMFSIKATK